MNYILVWNFLANTLFRFKEILWHTQKGGYVQNIMVVIKLYIYVRRIWKQLKRIFIFFKICVQIYVKHTGTKNWIQGGGGGSPYLLILGFIE